MVVRRAVLGKDCFRREEKKNMGIETKPKKKRVMTTTILQMRDVKLKLHSIITGRFRQLCFS